MSGLLNKVKDAVTGGHHDTTHHDTSSTTHRDTSMTGGSTGSTGTTSTQGPHSSNLANKVDPRVDSDGDGRTGMTGNTTSGTSGMTGMTGSHTTQGPHSSNLANKVDPRVDSDGDGRTGLTGGSTSSGLTGSTMTGGSSGYTGSSTSGSTGGMAGNLPPLGVTPQAPIHGHHTTVTGEILDPHIGSSTGSHGTPGMMGGVPQNTTTGGAPTTQGPHKSDMMNKLDPRVDSDADGSRLR